MTTGTVPFARLDHDRLRRRGYAESIFCAGKTTAQVLAIATEFVERGARNVIATRARDDVLDELLARWPDTRITRIAGVAVLAPLPVPTVGLVAVVASDRRHARVVEEAAIVAETMGSHVVRSYDTPLDEPELLPDWAAGLGAPNSAIVVDGSGAGLASIVSGLLPCPVLAVASAATSELHAAGSLLSALNSCSPGVAVLNVGNGFGAAYFAHLVNVAAATTGMWL